MVSSRDYHYLSRLKPSRESILTDLKKEMASEHPKKPFESNSQASRIEEDSKTSL